MTTGWVCGSQVATTWPPATTSPSFTLIIGAVRNLVALALATELVHHADLARAGHRNQVTLLVLHGLDVMEADRALVAHFDAQAAAARDAAPPMWNVRIVSCVPGSPIDCAAMTPTASPMLIEPAATEIAPVARRAHAVARVARDG